MVLDIGSQFYNNDTDIYNNDKGYYRLSNGAGSQKELLSCVLFLRMHGAMNADKCEGVIPVALPVSN